MSAVRRERALQSFGVIPKSRSLEMQRTSRLSPCRTIAAHRRAAAHRSNQSATALYPRHWRVTSDLCAQTNPIAVPWGRPGDARRRFAPCPRARAIRLLYRLPGTQSRISRRRPSGLMRAHRQNVQNSRVFCTKCTARFVNSGGCSTKYRRNTDVIPMRYRQAFSPLINTLP